MFQYTDKVREHFYNPRNVGELPDPDGVGTVGNPVCGDIMTFTIKVEDGRLKDIKFKTFGCGAAIAVSSMVTEMAMGKTLDEAMKITNEMVAEELGGLPKHKLHCSNLGADALHKAIEDYRAKQQKKMFEKQAESSTSKLALDHSKCPYCEQLIERDLLFCKVCQRELVTSEKKQ